MAKMLNFSMPLSPRAETLRPQPESGMIVIISGTQKGGPTHSREWADQASVCNKVAGPIPHLLSFLLSACNLLSITRMMLTEVQDHSESSAHS